jgi:RNA polymerase subunit RPABC4/transcription elongation factor Spt4
MAFLNCPECARQVSDQAPTCPQCGFPFLKTEYRFIEVYFDGSSMIGERRLDDATRDGWQIVNQQEVVEWEDGHSIEITKYKLQKVVNASNS